MALLRDNADLRDAVEEAAGRLGIPARQVEKDYWVTEVLRELARAFDGRFLFKGGTSLSKAYGLIRRFSEDIDLLLLSEPGEETEHLLDAMQDAAGRVCGTGASVRASTVGLARAIDVPYPRLANTPKASGMRRDILLEPGVRGGPRPHERRRVSSLLAETLELDDTDDVIPFDVPVLHPARTMVEKLFAGDAIADRLLADPGRRLRDTEARHFYDLYFLWDTEVSPAMAWLAEGTNFVEIVEDCIDVSTRWYPDTPATVPAGGFANSAAFTDPGVVERIAAGYEGMLDDVCYPDAPRPTYEDICARAEALADRLRP